ncbi:MAG: anaerobic ribonucleoside-triphosphate reductase activating protein [Deltaproteobacteria bacterium]|nr:anaerobic ribonucleoside-triphosphate reductase activating protein [Deltaproteobacteria bacterium]
MKSAVFTYQKTESTIDFEGRIALLFFTQGCNFRCRYCHNPDLIPVKDNHMTFDELGTILDRAGQNWVDGICITGGEPTMQETLPETLAFIKKKGMDIKLDTQGSFPNMLERVIQYCDYVAMDYKMPVGRYPEITGVQINPENIARSIDLLKNGNVEYEIRTTIVPGIHTEEDIKKICEELRGVRKFVLQRFFPRGNLPDKALRTKEKTPPELLEQFAQLSRSSFEEVVVR